MASRDEQIVWLGRYGGFSFEELDAVDDAQLARLVRAVQAVMEVSGGSPERLAITVQHVLEREMVSASGAERLAGGCGVPTEPNPVP